MIPSQFYDADPNYDAYSFMGIRSTYELKSIPINTQEFTQAYWVGWVGWETLPQHYHISNSSFENGVLTFTDITKPENVPIGFSTHPTPSLTLANYTAYAIEYDANQSKWYTPTWINSANARGAACDNFHLPNAYDVNTGSWGRLKLLFFGLSSDNTTEIQASAEVPYMSFASGASFNAIIFDSGAYNNMIFNVTIDDISEYSSFKKTINNTEFNIVLGMYTIPYIRDCGYNNSAAGYNCVHPMVQVHTLDNFPYVIGVTNPFDFQFRDDFYWGASGGVSYNGQGCRIGWDGSIISLGSYLHNGVYDWFGGYVGSFTLVDMPTSQLRLIVPDGANFYMRGIGRSDFFIMGRIFTHDEILHSLSLFPRLTDGTSNRYENSANYFYGVVDSETSEFKGTLVDGTDITKLVDWQIVNNNIEDNTITDDDIPEYVPPSPGDDDEPHGGPGWLANNVFPYGALNGFVTLYCLTPKQLGAFGQYLWAGFFDADFIDSLVVTTFEAASLNTSDILNFIPSVKYYPIPLNNLNNWHGGSDSTIFIGRGAKGIDLNTAAHVGNLTAYCAGVDCESEDIEPVFGDFRDFEPCTRLTLFVPFCGVMELTPSQVMGKGQPGKVYLKYLIDFSTGACECAVEIKNCGWRTIVGTLTGSIGANVELTASNLSQVIQSFGKAVVGAGATVALATVGLGQASALEEMGGRATQAEAAMSNAEKGLLANQANNISSLLSLSTVPAPTAGTSGGYSAFINLTPMIQRTYHHYEVPANYAHVYGYACNKTVTLSDLNGKGYTVCSNVELSGIPATQDELAAIESLLTSGVYF